MTVLSYQKIKEAENLGRRSLEVNAMEPLKSHKGMKNCCSVFHRAKTNRAIGETSGRSI